MPRRCLALLALLILCPAANAAPFTPELEMAYNLAIARWGQPTNCMSIELAIVPDDLTEYEGQATQPSEPMPCELWIIRRLAAPRMFGRACSVIFHEVGHLNGVGHSDDPHSLMYPNFAFVVPICAQRTIWLMNRRRK